jgi:hypothetical protein
MHASSRSSKPSATLPSVTEAPYPSGLAVKRGRSPLVDLGDSERGQTSVRAFQLVPCADLLASVVSGASHAGSLR